MKINKFFNKFLLKFVDCSSTILSNFSKEIKTKKEENFKFSFIFRVKIFEENLTKMKISIKGNLFGNFTREKIHPYRVPDDSLNSHFYPVKIFFMIPDNPIHPYRVPDGFLKLTLLPGKNIFHDIR